MRHKNNLPAANEQEYIYIKIPFINEEFKRRALGVVRRSGISNVKIHFENGKSLSKVFPSPRVKPRCSKDCETCKLAEKPNRCLLMNVVYLITCTTLVQPVALCIGAIATNERILR